MANATPVPRKFLNLLDEVQDVLRDIAGKIHKLVAELKETGGLPTHAVHQLKDIESEIYRTALNLSEIEVARDCKNCPAAPAVTPADAKLIVLTDALFKLAEYARKEVETYQFSNQQP